MTASGETPGLALNQQLTSPYESRSADLGMPNDPLPEIPGYILLRELGRGGMGVVYLARQQMPNRLVALKLLLHGQYATNQSKQRFTKEAEVIARLQHRNIIQIHEVGIHEGTAFVVLEYLPGGSLDRKLREQVLSGRDSA